MNILTPRKIRVMTTHSGGGIGISRLSRDEFEFVFGVEMDAKIANVYTLNYGNEHLLVKKIEDVTDAEWRAIGEVDIAQFSPVCKNFSKGKHNAKEEEGDISQALAVGRAIAIVKPKAVVVENVWQYRNSTSFEIITDLLGTLGYKYEFKKLNSADYGTPQTRERLFLVAIREDYLGFGGSYNYEWPRPTHHKGPEISTIWGDNIKPWVGWYEAVEDIIHTFPVKAFAEWQLERLDEWFKKKGYDFDNVETFLMRGTNAQQEGSNQARTAEEPSHVMSCREKPRAFLADSKNSRSNGKPAVTVREDEEPGFTMLASERNRPKAFIVPGDNTSNDNSVRADDEPMVVVRARNITQCAPRAFIIDGQPNDRGTKITLREENEPAHTIMSSVAKKPIRAWLEYGEVRQFTVEGIARLMGVPHTYKLTGHGPTDSVAVGNGIAAQVIEALFRNIKEHIVNTEKRMAAERAS